ncbi:MAG TPA: HD domain-containing protein [Candidatus Deferrimicrobiaceae bacterium]|nr:HD domain-containing protein [Candidatus Deferrimicrobiaceae bacterium]
MPQAGQPISIEPPADVVSLMRRLWTHGHAAYVVGGSIRDALLGRPASDWDLATDARPDRLLSIFPGAVYENQFGTVAVRDTTPGAPVHEITTFRTDHEYADFRRPHRVEFGDDVRLDLARRDFTVNAMAWGADAPPARHPPLDAPGPTPALVDPYGGASDCEARLLRAVGDPGVRFREDALRMVRAVRLAAVLSFTIESGTLAAIRAGAALSSHLSGERVAAELEKLLAAQRPSAGLGLLAETGLLDVLLPELATQRGVPQNKISGDDLWAHTLRTVDAAPADRPVVRFAALLHDVGKPATIDDPDGPFRGHEVVGTEMAAAIVARLRLPKTVAERIVHLVRQHMFTYDSGWSDAAVRRFIQRVGIDALPDLLALREADNVGSGTAHTTHGLPELRGRVQAELDASVALDRRGLAVRGDDLMAELGVPAGPTLGRILDELLERVVADPSLNDRPTLLLLAAAMLAEPE